MGQPQHDQKHLKADDETSFLTHLKPERGFDILWMSCCNSLPAARQNMRKVCVRLRDKN
jgi:hypothetical protein